VRTKEQDLQAYNKIKEIKDAEQRNKALSEYKFVWPPLERGAYVIAKDEEYEVDKPEDFPELFETHIKEKIIKKQDKSSISV
jgi:hypothetical protein